MRTILICKCSTWNTLKTKNPQKTNFADFFLFQIIFKKTKKSLTFWNFWRGGASSRSTIILHGPQKRVTAMQGKVMVYFQQSSKIICENWRGGASSSATMIYLVYLAPIIVQFRCDVKSFLWPAAIKCNLVSVLLTAPIIPYPAAICQVLFANFAN